MDIGEKQLKKHICIKNFNHTYQFIYLRSSTTLNKLARFFPRKHIRDSVFLILYLALISPEKDTHYL